MNFFFFFKFSSLLLLPGLPSHFSHFCAVPKISLNSTWGTETCLLYGIHETINKRTAIPRKAYERHTPHRVYLKWGPISLPLLLSQGKALFMENEINKYYITRQATPLQHFTFPKRELLHNLARLNSQWKQYFQCLLFSMPWIVLYFLT